MLKKILGVFMLASIVLFVSCDKDTTDDGVTDGTDSTSTDSTAAEDTVSLGGDDSASVELSANLVQETADAMDGDATALVNSEGMRAAMDFLELMNDGDFNNRSMYSNASVTKDIISIMKSNFIPTVSYSAAEDSSDYEDDYEDDNEEDELDPEEMKNFTLTWNSAEKNWDAEEDRTDEKIVFIYPTKGSSSNNATLTIHNIETEEFIFEDSCWYENEMGEWLGEDCTDTIYQPNKIKLDLVVSGTKYVDVDIALDFDAEGEPTSVDAMIEVLPFKVEFDASRTSSTLDGSFKLSKNGNVVVDILADVDMKEIEVEDGETEMAPDAVVGSFRMFGLKLEVSASDIVETIESIENDEISEDEAIEKVNQMADAIIYAHPSGTKIGEIILTKLDSVDEWGDQVIMPAVMFNDSTIKPLDQVMQPLLETIENFFCDNFGGEDC
jgi:hypothetical protein